MFQLEGFKHQQEEGCEAMENKENQEQNGNDSESKRDTQTIKIGSRSATLFLSSPSINLKQKQPDDAYSKTNTPEPLSRQSTKAKREKSKLMPDELKHLKPKREFTFTGYDIMADGRS